MHKPKIFTLFFFATFSFALCVQNTTVYAQDLVPWGPAPRIENPMSPYVQDPPAMFPTSRAFAYDAAFGVVGPSKFFLNTPGTVVNMTGGTNFFAGGSWVPGPPGRWYAVQFNAPRNFLYCDTVTGASTIVGPVGAIVGSPVGLGWDPATNNMYFVTAAPTNLYTINMSTGVATLVAPITGVVNIIACAVSNGGQLYGIELQGAGNLGRINKTTGVWTTVGPLGLVPIFAQACEFDRSDNKFYWASYATIGQLRTIDTVTGNSTIIGAFQANAEMDGLAIPFAPSAPVQACSRYHTTWCAQGTYPNIPAATLYNACAWIGDTMYMHSPDGTGTATTLIRRYTLGGTWTTGVPLPVPKTQGTLTSAAGKMYFIGGSATAGGSGSTDVYEYNPATGAWTLKAPLVSATQGHGAGNWGDSVIFVIMGPWGIPSTTCQFYRIGSNTTGLTTPFTGAARRSHAVGLWGNKIFVAGGFPFTNTFYIGTIGANASTVTWAVGPSYPSNPKSRIGGVAVGDRFYIIGGNNSVGTTSSDSTFIWQISAASWTALGSVKPAAVHNNSAAVTYKCVGDTVKIFCPGGSSQSATTLNLDVLGCGGTVVGIDPVISQIPDKYELSQNYPNPFNPSTKISYALPKAGDVKLVVFDLLGREVATLVNGFNQAGNHSIEFNASALASGVYLYRLESGSFTDTKKMLLIK